MGEYRIYLLDDGGVAEPPYVITCPDDEAAKRQAERLATSRRVELWRDNYRVALIEPKP